ncbi:MAG: EAL domain-containing protein [Rhizobiales bacterium]|nr:EAL domain-containing protein [Hyphomicrobiales bacterium]MBN9010512.1 EAL domain-containing protein [Hyphomicrobiales bacterium]
MKLFSRDQEKPVVPLDIYASLVDALYDVRQSLFLGSLASAIAALLTAWKAQDWVLLVIAIAIVGVAWLRTLDMQNYAKLRDTLLDREALRVWEYRYVVGSSVHVALLGAWVLAAFVLTGDPFIRLFAFSGALAFMIGISGRNFASDLLVTSQIICAAIPMSAAIFVAGGWYLAIFVLLLLPFFAAVRLISNRLRQTLLDAVIATRDMTMLAMRFDTALNNMPHGLAMFDSEGRLVVANNRLIELFDLPKGLDVNGMTARELLTHSVGAGQAPHLDVEHFISDFEAHLAGVMGSIFVEIRDGQTLALTRQRMENGGSVVIAEDITDRRKAEERIHHLAHYDSLTDLPNRTYLHDALQRMLSDMRRSGPLAILFVDLDQFKQVNDTLGHPRGDELLRAVAGRLRGLLRRSDVVARFGGDEFVVLQSPVRSTAEATELADRIVEQLSYPYQIDGHQIVIGASVGIAMAPRDGVDADSLLKNADMALYHAKVGGRGAWRFFEPEMDARAQARRAVELDLRRALAEGEFELFFQPLLNLRTMRVTTCEALIRWRHPQRGMVPPMEFIPVAEDMGLIIEIGDWVLRQACLECMRWPSDVRVAVNLSPIQFRRDNLQVVIAQALAHSKLPANRLEVEITESVLLQDVKKAREMLEQFAEMGVRVSLDDFGTGYSGLSYLNSFPFHKVKIDRSFVRSLDGDERALTLLRGVANLTASLGMTVTVEGVETEAQLATLAAEPAIDEAQGYLFSVPIPARQIRELLASSRPGWAAIQPPVARTG